VVAAAEAAQAPLARVRRVVLGTPGLVDPATGEISFAWDLPRWHGGLLGALRADLGRPVVFENDVNLAAIAEAHSGAAQGVSDFALVWVSRGVGLAVVLGGRLHRGTNGAAGEIGYLPVPGAPVPRGVSRQAEGSFPGAFQQLIGTDVVRTVAREHGFKAATAAAVVEKAVAAGEAGAPVLDEIARRLALGVVAVGVVLDPALVVLAGDVGRAGGDALAQRVQQEVAAIVPVSPRVVTTGVPADPVLHGALLTGLDAVREEVFGSTLDND